MNYYIYDNLTGRGWKATEREAESLCREYCIDWQPGQFMEASGFIVKPIEPHKKPESEGCLKLAVFSVVMGALGWAIIALVLAL